MQKGGVIDVREGDWNAGNTVANEKPGYAEITYWRRQGEIAGARCEALTALVDRWRNVRERELGKAKNERIRKTQVVLLVQRGAKDRAEAKDLLERPPPLSTKRWRNQGNITD